MRPLLRDQLRDRRLVMQAIACVDSALWDALAKTLGVPLFQLWGGFRSASGTDDRHRRLATGR